MAEYCDDVSGDGIFETEMPESYENLDLGVDLTKMTDHCLIKYSKEAVAKRDFNAALRFQVELGARKPESTAILSVLANALESAKRYPEALMVRLKIADLLRQQDVANDLRIAHLRAAADRAESLHSGPEESLAAITKSWPNFYDDVDFADDAESLPITVLLRYCDQASLSEDWPKVLIIATLIDKRFNINLRVLHALALAQQGLGMKMEAAATYRRIDDLKSAHQADRTLKMTRQFGTRARDAVVVIRRGQQPDLRDE